MADEATKEKVEGFELPAALASKVVEKVDAKASGEKKEYYQPPMRVWLLLDAESGEAIESITARLPQQAAVKAAKNGHTKILIRETDTIPAKKVHVYSGSRVDKQTPDTAPSTVSRPTYEVGEAKKIKTIELKE